MLFQSIGFSFFCQKTNDAILTIYSNRNTPMSSIPKPVVLIVLDGWGISNTTQGNPIREAKLPFFEHLNRNYPLTANRPVFPCFFPPRGNADPHVLNDIFFWAVENPPDVIRAAAPILDRKSTRLNSSHIPLSRMPSSA